MKIYCWEERKSDVTVCYAQAEVLGSPLLVTAFITGKEPNKLVAGYQRRNVDLLMQHAGFDGVPEIIDSKPTPGN